MLDTAQADMLVSARHDLAARIDQASDVLRQLERQLAATKTVAQQLNTEGSLSGKATVAAVAPQRKPEPFRPGAFLRCMSTGHDMVESRSMPGRMTCRRCKMRRRA